ncbi:DNA (cytosine-5-)-methyltransferase [Vibrio metschnikovii]|nr:DNA (cytosine-5-)-methyltransferase [Vibrio metschnikovii]EKO3691725.1 DNA (cytosine-5-)-methyltransferase [Vibrio metschnikovii]EKO3695069.1 DNA (cytosine-5-)-methyltransferase [Vibrio metschnikovii]EKO3892381.1 DNA (cytosine-5-)-methyltransferase [Vibrio metschnikovii]
MTDNILKLGDALEERLHKEDREESHKLLKLLVEVYDQKNLAIKLNELGFKTSRESLNRWKKNPESQTPALDEASRNHIRKHLLPSKPLHWDDPSFEFIDLFAGIGGIRKGFEEIGGKCVFTSEWDEKARRTYLANHYVDEQELPYFLNNEEESKKKNTSFMDITNITLSKNQELSDEEKAEHIREHIPPHDVLLAGFPCQPFSLAGVSKKNSLGRAHGFECETQGTLFFDVEKIIEARQPKFFVLENVKNLKSHDQGNTFAVIIRALDRLGYWVADITDAGENNTIEDAIKAVRKRKNDPVIIDGMHFIPQHRERVVLVGIRKDLDINYSDFSLRNISKPENRLTVEEILCQLSKEEQEKYTLTPNLWNYLYNYALKHQTKGNGFGFGLVNPDDKQAVTRTLSARYHKDGSEILINHQGLELDYLESRKAPCIRKIEDRNNYIDSKIKKFTEEYQQASSSDIRVYTKEMEAKYNELYGRYAEEFDPHYKTPRRLTPQECARLMGFEKPEQYRGEDETDFRIVCADASAYKQFGNSVVVPVFRAVANLMKPYIEAAIVKSKETKNSSNAA